MGLVAAVVAALLSGVTQGQAITCVCVLAVQLQSGLDVSHERVLEEEETWHLELLPLGHRDHSLHGPRQNGVVVRVRIVLEQNGNLEQ